MVQELGIFCMSKLCLVLCCAVVNREHQTTDQGMTSLWEKKQNKRKQKKKKNKCDELKAIIQLMLTSTSTICFDVKTFFTKSNLLNINFMETEDKEVHLITAGKKTHITQTKKHNKKKTKSFYGCRSHYQFTAARPNLTQYGHQ